MTNVWFFGLGSDLILWAFAAGLVVARVWRMKPR